jgi:chorismate synthase
MRFTHVDVDPEIPARSKPPGIHPSSPTEGAPEIRYNPCMLRFFTAGESHGEALVANVSGLPAGIPVSEAYIDQQLWRRQQGYGRGGRMKIEHDHAHILSGVRHGHTIGAPIAMLIDNRDWQNWSESLPVGEGDPEKHKPVKSPRPGHADLAGALKYNLPEARYVLERASARETTSRVAAGAVAKQLLAVLDIEVLSHVIQVGGARLTRAVSYDELRALAQKPEVLLNCADEESEQRMKAEVDAVLRTGDTVGGIFEVVAHNVPPGLGTYANWDERLDARLAAAVMSIQAVKAVEIGDGVLAAASHGSAAQDEIGYAHSGEPAGTLHSKFTQFTRAGNHAGGLEGGITNGCDVVVRGHLKPISTLRRPLGSVDFASREPVKAAYERSDVCAVPAGGVVGEAMVALALAQAALEKFGGDSLVEMRRNYEGYCEQLRYY